MSYTTVIASSPIYKLALIFFAVYPLVTSLVWIWMSFNYFLRKESPKHFDYYEVEEKDLPFISIIVPTFCEALSACGTGNALLSLDYPNYEVIFVDDGSGDETFKKEHSFLLDPKVRTVKKNINEGKAIAINDVLPVAKGDYVLIIDGDSAPHPDILRWMVPRFFHTKNLGAVTGNPRVTNRESLLAKIQTVEFSSIISLIKRAQVVYGRVTTVSGVMALYKKEALEKAGLFVHDGAAEDILTSWELQRCGYEIHYEPHALTEMRAPETVKALWRQRIRWSKGLAQALRRNVDIFKDWRQNRMYPLYIEAVLSITWAYCFVVLAALWITTYALGHPLLGASLIPAWWGMLIGSMSLVQQGVGVLMDGRYDPKTRYYYLWASLYPLFYWTQMAIITAIASPIGWFKPHGSGRWKTEGFR